MKSRSRILHGSIYARDPERAASHLAALTSGVARPFHPIEGAWACFLNDEDWETEIVEFYPRTVTIASRDGVLEFSSLVGEVRGAGSHFNISIPKKRRDLELICKQQGLVYSWRDWQGVLEVWLEDEILIECVPIE